MQCISRSRDDGSSVPTLIDDVVDVLGQHKPGFDGHLQMTNDTEYLNKGRSRDLYECRLYCLSILVRRLLSGPVGTNWTAAQRYQ